jgi:hypothetical protein
MSLEAQKRFNEKFALDITLPALVEDLFISPNPQE